MKYILFLLTALTLTAISCKDSESQADIDDQKILDYAAENNLDLESHDSGIYYKIIKEGTGTARPSSSSNVKVNYIGTFLDDVEFDSGQSVPFFVNEVITGWQIAVPLMLKGEKTRFFIPSGLCYGTTGSGNIPANTVLIFEIELIDF